MAKTFSFLKWLNPFTPIEERIYNNILRYKKTLIFRYVSYATLPDMIEVYLNERAVISYYSWNWLDGLDADENSLDGKMNKLFSERGKNVLKDIQR